MLRRLCLIAMRNGRGLNHRGVDHYKTMINITKEAVKLGRGDYCSSHKFYCQTCNKLADDGVIPCQWCPNQQHLNTMIITLSSQTTYVTTVETIK